MVFSPRYFLLEHVRWTFSATATSSDHQQPMLFELVAMVEDVESFTMRNIFFDGGPITRTDTKWLDVFVLRVAKPYDAPASSRYGFRRCGKITFENVRGRILSAKQAERTYLYLVSIAGKYGISNTNELILRNLFVEVECEGTARIIAQGFSLGGSAGISTITAVNVGGRVQGTTKNHVRLNPLSLSPSNNVSLLSYSVDRLSAVSAVDADFIAQQFRAESPGPMAEIIVNTPAKVSTAAQGACSAEVLGLGGVSGLKTLRMIGDSHPTVVGRITFSDGSDAHAILNVVRLNGNITNELESSSTFTFRSLRILVNDLSNRRAVLYINIVRLAGLRSIIHPQLTVVVKDCAIGQNESSSDNAIQYSSNFWVAPLMFVGAVNSIDSIVVSGNRVSLPRVRQTADVQGNSVVAAAIFVHPVALLQEIRTLEVRNADIDVQGAELHSSLVVAALHIFSLDTSAKNIAVSSCTVKSSATSKSSGAEPPPPMLTVAIVNLLEIAVTTTGTAAASSVAITDSSVVIPIMSNAAALSIAASVFHADELQITKLADEDKGESVFPKFFLRIAGCRVGGDAAESKNSVLQFDGGGGTKLLFHIVFYSSVDENDDAALNIAVDDSSVSGLEVSAATAAAAVENVVFSVVGLQIVEIQAAQTLVVRGCKVNSVSFSGRAPVMNASIVTLGLGYNANFFDETVELNISDSSLENIPSGCNCTPCATGETTNGAVGQTSCVATTTTTTTTTLSPPPPTTTNSTENATKTRTRPKFFEDEQELVPAPAIAGAAAVAGTSTAFTFFAAPGAASNMKAAAALGSLVTCGSAVAKMQEAVLATGDEDLVKPVAEPLGWSDNLFGLELGAALVSYQGAVLSSILVLLVVLGGATLAAALLPRFKKDTTFKDGRRMFRVPGVLAIPASIAGPSLAFVGTVLIVHPRGNSVFGVLALLVCFVLLVYFTVAGVWFARKELLLEEPEKPSPEELGRRSTLLSLLLFSTVPVRDWKAGPVPEQLRMTSRYYGRVWVGAVDFAAAAIVSAIAGVAEGSCVTAACCRGCAIGSASVAITHLVVFMLFRPALIPLHRLYLPAMVLLSAVMSILAVTASFLDGSSPGVETIGTVASVIFYILLVIALVSMAGKGFGNLVIVLAKCKVKWAVRLQHQPIPRFDEDEDVQQRGANLRRAFLEETEAAEHSLGAVAMQERSTTRTTRTSSSRQQQQRIQEEEEIEAPLQQRSPYPARNSHRRRHQHDDDDDDDDHGSSFRNAMETLSPRQHGNDRRGRAERRHHREQEQEPLRQPRIHSSGRRGRDEEEEAERRRVASAAADAADRDRNSSRRRREEHDFEGEREHQQHHHHRSRRQEDRHQQQRAHSSSRPRVESSNRGDNRRRGGRARDHHHHRDHHDHHHRESNRHDSPRSSPRHHHRDHHDHQHHHAHRHSSSSRRRTHHNDDDDDQDSDDVYFREYSRRQRGRERNGAAAPAAAAAAAASSSSRRASPSRRDRERERARDRNDQQKHQKHDGEKKQEKFKSVAELLAALDKVEKKLFPHLAAAKNGAAPAPAAAASSSSTRRASSPRRDRVGEQREQQGEHQQRPREQSSPRRDRQHDGSSRQLQAPQQQPRELKSRHDRHLQR